MGNEYEELYKNSKKILKLYTKITPSILMRNLAIGYARSATLIDILRERKVIDKSGRIFDK